MIQVRKRYLPNSTYSEVLAVDSAVPGPVLVEFASWLDSKAVIVMPLRQTGLVACSGSGREQKLVCSAIRMLLLPPLLVQRKEPTAPSGEKAKDAEATFLDEEAKCADWKA